jgi:hypothetical protein
MLLHSQGCCLFQSLRFRNVLQEVQRRFCTNSKSKKSNPKHPSGRPSITFGRSSVRNIHLDDVAIQFGHPSVSGSFELFKVTTFRMSQQHVRTLISVRQEIGFPSQTQIWEDTCIRLDVRSTTSGRYP